MVLVIAQTLTTQNNWQQKDIKSWQSIQLMLQHTMFEIIVQFYTGHSKLFSQEI